MEEKVKEKLVKALKGIRVESRRSLVGKGESVIKVGDIVWSEKNKEYGIVLGVKPIETGEYLLEKMEKKSMFDGIKFSRFPEKDCCILLTLSQDTHPGLYEARVRYTGSQYLEKAEVVSEEVETLSDLNQHCQNECFMECSEDCSLWKYKKC